MYNDSILYAVSTLHVNSTLYVAGTLYVQFRSNDVFDATGFEATYQFYSAVQGREIVDVLNAR